MRYKLYEAPSNEETSTGITSNTSGDIGKTPKWDKHDPAKVASQAEKLSKDNSIPAQVRYRILRDLLNDNSTLKRGGDTFIKVQEYLGDMIKYELFRKAGSSIGVSKLLNDVDKSLGDRKGLFWQQFIEAFKWEELNKQNNVFLSMLKSLANVGFKTNESLLIEDDNRENRKQQIRSVLNFRNNFDWKKFQQLYNIYVNDEDINVVNGKLEPNIGQIILGFSSDKDISTDSSDNTLNINKNENDIIKELSSKDAETLVTLKRALDKTIDLKGDIKL